MPGTGSDKKADQDWIRLEPESELVFKGPFDQPSTAILQITNRTDLYLCYKVKTTAPKSYCVRPNAALLGPRAATTVSVMLQPTSESINEKTRHRFMVQATIVPENSAGDIAERIWKETQPDKVQDVKLRVVFEGITQAGGNQTLDPASTYEEGQRAPPNARADQARSLPTAKSPAAAAAAASASGYSSGTGPSASELRHRTTPSGNPNAHQASQPTISTPKREPPAAGGTSFLYLVIYFILFLIYTAIIFAIGYSVAGAKR